MVSMTSPGFMTGSLATRFLADQLGRRATILASVLPVAVGTLIVAFSVQAWLLYLTRFLWGTGSGMVGTVIALYLAEVVDKEIRGKLTLVTRFMFNFGNLLIMCIGPFVAYRTLNFMLLALPLCTIVTCWWIPESPYYLLKEGKVDEARKVLTVIRLYEDDKMLEDDLSQLRSDVRNEMRSSSSAKELFTGKKYRKAVFIATGMKLTQILTGQLIVAQYLGLIMMESRTNIPLSIVFIIFGAVRFVTGVMSSILADRLGRRPLLIYSYLGAGISLFIIGIYFFLLEVLQIHHEVLQPVSFIPFAGIIACNVISTLGYYSVITLVPAEIFPLNIKAVAMTSLSIFGGLLNFGVARGYQGLKDVAGLCGVFSFLGTAAVAGCIFCTLYVHETKGKSLREIQILLQGDLYKTDDIVKLNQVESDLDKDVPEMKELLEVSNKAI
ncbi:facilitated trehalose transporter Tret1-like isoform X2 [Pectinophora gossypiella]|nr:facilitated trehalose transporter Tret1-like isoform X2 [Pectinophora gossypiella]